MLGRLKLGNEWRFLSRQPLVWLALAGAVIMSAVMAGGSPAPSGSTPAEALLRVNLFIPAFILPFLAAALGPTVFLREVEHDMSEIVGSYPMTVTHWLGVRLGSCLIVLVAACALAQLAMLATLASADPAAVPALTLQSLGWLLVIHAPACLIWSCLLARLSCATGHPGILYFAAGFGWVAYIALAMLTGTPLIGGSYVAWEPLRQALIIFDPYAITALVNPMPENGLLQSRAANIALGRIAWLAVCLWMLRGIIDLPARSRREEKAGKIENPDRSLLPDVVSRLPGWARHVGLHLRHVMRDRAFPLMVGGWLLLLGPEVYSGLSYAEPLAQVDPDSRDALNRVMWDIVPIAAALVLLYAADRVCRMYGAVRMHELVAATPYRSWLMVGVQILALWTVAVFFLALAGLAVVAAQLAAGSPIELWEYMLQLGLALPQLLLFGMLFAAVHALIRLRFAANLVNLLLVILGFTSLAPSLGFHHPLWRPLASPLAAPDHYWGFESSIAGYAPFLVFWSAVCLALVLLGMVLNHRGMAFRQMYWRSALRHPAIALVLTLAVGSAIQGRLIHVAFADEGLLVSPDERIAQRADYERNYGQWDAVAQPDVAAVRFQIDFHPSLRSAQLRASMTLVNRTKVPIEQVLVGRNQIPWDGDVRMGDAALVQADARLGQDIFRFQRAMQPGETRELSMAALFRQSGLVTASMPLVLRPTFSSLPAHALLPVIGFEREFTLRDPDLRRAQGLPERQLTPPSQLPPQSARLSADLANIETLITTEKSDHAIAPGELVSSWQANGRNHFLYRSEGAMRNLPAFYSVPWRPQTWKAGPIALEVHAPQRLSADDPNLRAMRDTLEWLGSEVAPYQSRTLRLIAVPEAGLSGYALPQTVLLSHRLAIRAYPTADAGFSQAYRRAAHETAHQWFGHMIGHGIPEEHGFLVESLTKYAELVIVERHEGGDAMQALVAYEWDRYRGARLDLAAPVAPLIDAEESEDMYSRATLVFACLRQQIGDEPILKALRAITSQGETTGRPVRSVDFVDALIEAANPMAEGTIRALLLDRAPLPVTLAKSGCNLNDPQFLAR
ncbi:MAG: hypothetical protein APF78_01605 [Sphingomonadales bacterium BRH_c3]|nr:MAG: hypothetical protein APF78_01605 [Sphingomonadales bacterium BRH_c3]